MKNIQYHRVEMYKEANDVLQEVMKEALTFLKKLGYNLKQRNIFIQSLFNSV